MSQKIKFLIQPLLIILVLVLNMLAFKNPFVGGLLTLIYFYFFSFYFGQRIFFSQKKYFRFFLGFIFLIAEIILSSVILYYTLGLTNFSIFLVLLMPLVTTIFLPANQTTPTQPFASISSEENNKKDSKKIIFFLNLIYSGLFIALFYFLIINSSSEALVSPWTVLPTPFFLLYFLATFLVLFEIIKFPSSKNIILVVLQIFLSASVAVIIYQIGYGFDPFIHRVAEKIIFTQGFVLPQTPYYIGQYGLTVFIAKISYINLTIIDKFLAPILGALLIPLVTYFAFLKLMAEKKMAQILALFAALLTLFSFFVTTPQHLANLFLIVFVWLVFINLNSATLKINQLWFLGLSITAIHPLAGLPALMCCWLCWLKTRPQQKLVFNFSVLIFLFILPIIFLSATFLLPNFNLTFNFNGPQELLKTWLAQDNYLSFYSFLHAPYLLKKYFILLVILGSSLGFWKFYKTHSVITDKKIFIFPWLIFILLFNALLLKCLNFSAVISYEQNIFPMRFVHAAYFFALPFLLYLATVFKLDKKYDSKKISLLIFTLSFIAVSIFYFSYPRYDRLEKNKGYGVSTADLQAVQLVEQKNITDNYVVLANQSTAAAALQEFGFKKYYNNLFYYPLPTSSPLYQIYLDITYQGIQPKFISSAKQLTGVQNIYLIFNDYWTNYKKLVIDGKNTAKESWEIMAGKAWIFKY